MFSRILITGDFLRPLDRNPFESESVRRIRWFEDLLTPPLSLVTDLPIHRLACEHDWSLGSLYGDSGFTPSLDSWAELYAGELTGSLRNRILDRCRDAIVLSIELPPSVARVLAQEGVPVIDAVVDPHRFLADIPLGWRSTIATVRGRLATFQVTPFEIRRAVANIKAKSRWIHEIAVPEQATLVLDQVTSDSAMIDPITRQRVSWSNYRDRLEALKTSGPILWRPHPHNADAQAATTVLGDATRTDANIYHLLSHDHLVRVAAISSGGVTEARAFGKEGIHFLDRYAGIDLEGWPTPTAIIGDWVSPHFWSAILAPLTDVRTDVPALSVEKNFLRRSINCDWGFGWIDQVVAA